jgi:hypothetical protein
LDRVNDPVETIPPAWWLILEQVLEEPAEGVVCAWALTLEGRKVLLGTRAAARLQGELRRLV